MNLRSEEPRPQAPRPPRRRARLVVILVAALVAVVAVGAMALTRPGSEARPRSATGGPSGPTTASPEPSAQPSASEPSPSTDPSTGPSGSQTPQQPEPTKRKPSWTSCLTVPSLTPMTVLTFNIHAGVSPDGAQLGAIAEEIRRTGADVVLLQEVDRFRSRSRYVDTPAWLAAELGMYQAFAANLVLPSTARGGGRQEYGLATLSQWPIVDSERVALPRPPGTEQRGLLRTRLDLGDYELDVYNTHLEHSSGAARRQQVRTILDVLADREEPAVIGGDFNATEGGPVHSMLAASLTDAWLRVGEGEGHTVPARAPRSRIDQVFVAGPLIPLAARVVTSAISDHRAVGVDLMVAHLADPTC